MEIKRDEEMLNFHMKYMDKFESMSNDERKVFVKYMEFLGSPEIIISRDSIDIDDIGLMQAQ